MREADRLKALKSTTVVMAQQKKPQQSKRSEKRETRKRAVKARISGGANPFQVKLYRAGILISPGVYTALAFVLCVCILIIGCLVGPVLGISAFGVGLYFLFGPYLDDRAQKRKKAVVPQIAPFIDSFVSGLSSGQNVEGALEHAAGSVPPGIFKTEMNRVQTALQRGFTTKEALSILKDRIEGNEVTALVVSVGLFTSMGGTALDPFRRLARKIREQQAVIDRAHRDLVMVKQAFYIILGLAVIVPAVLLTVQPDYLATAFNDSFGRVILQLSGSLVLVALLVFRKIISVKV